MRIYPTWFDGLSRAGALGVLAALALAIGLSVMSQPASETVPIHQSTKINDVKLYGFIAARVAKGERYHDAAAAVHRTYGYPLRPFMTIRQPALAWISATLGTRGFQTLFAMICVLAVAAWLVRLKVETGNLIAPVVLVLPLFFTALGFATTTMHNFHESWAAMLIALSLAVRTHKHYAAAAVIGIAAALIRETAVAYLVLMAVMSAFERQKRETTFWAIAILVFAAGFALHAMAATAVANPNDYESVGWSEALGWPLVISASNTMTLLALTTPLVTAAALPLCLFGWAAMRSPSALRVTGLISGYIVMLAVLARSDTSYWAIMFTPLLLTGLFLALPALYRLLAIIVGPRTTAHQIPTGN